MADALLGILIKDMNSGCINSNLDLIAGTSGRTGRNSCDNVLAVGSIFHTLKAEVEIDLCTHKLGNVDVNVEYGVCHGVKEHRLIVNSLGTNTEDNVLTDVFLKIGVVRLISGKRNLSSTKGSVRIRSKRRRASSQEYR